MHYYIYFFPIIIIQLKANEFMNLDAILEGVMLKLIVIPLRDHLYQLFVTQYTETGSIQQLTENIIYARTRRAQDLGLRVSFYIIFF